MSARRRLLAWATAAPGRAGALLLAPGALVLVALVAIPLLIMAGTSLLERGTYGGVERALSGAAYARALEPLYLRILGRTAAYAVATTALCALVGFPMAWCIARAGRWRGALLFLVVLPFWTSALVRTYAMMFLLRDSGVVNTLLRALGGADRPLHLLYTPGAVLLGLVTTALPFMVLPLYATLERLDPALLEAAEVLGARPWARFARVILPLAAPGLAAGALLVFVPTLGALLVPDLMGGKTMLLGTLVQGQFGPARDWPFGSALSFVMMGLVLLGFLLRRGPGGVAAPAERVP
ncbi:MAG: ABC transporter permease [Gemmatimonadales bacterium]|nr:ABC transporter permease [Gemmatimonadales bacterium]